jgi:dTDP-4-dehydrorhamnose 3,5-epimerase
MSNLDIKEGRLDGVLVITPPTVFKDSRGFYVEIYNREIYDRSGIKIEFVQDDISVSSKNVLRGIHGDMKTWKLVSCPYGKFYLVIVNCDRESSNFGRWEAFMMSDSKPLQVLVPPKCGIAHLVMSEKAVFHYKQSTYYDRAGQFTYRWDDPRFKISWPVRCPILSERDKKGG